MLCTVVIKGEGVAEVVIIGAGLTGLSAAYHLEQHNFFDYTIIEQHSRPGGLLKTEAQDGFMFDHTGHLLHISDTYFKEFLNTVAGLDNFNLIARKAAIFSHNVFTDYPFQINLFGLPTNVAVECIEAYVNRPSIKNPSNLHQWTLKHFGSGFAKHFFFPYDHKMYAYDLRKIHPSQKGRFFPSTNLAAIIKGTIEKKPPTDVGYNSNFYYPKHGGIEFLIKKLCSNLKNKVVTNSSVERIDPIKKIIYCHDGQSVSYRRLISTMPLDQLLSSLQTTSHTSLKKAAAKLLCNSVINVNLGFSVDNIGPHHWVYFPEKSFPLYRLGFWNNLSSSSVPAGCSGVYGELSYQNRTTSYKKSQEHAYKAIDKTLAFLGLCPNHIITQKLLHLKHAYVIYDAWREKHLPSILTQLQEWDIHSIGRYGEWKYSSMQEAVLDGKKVANTIIQQHTPRIIPARKDQPSLKHLAKEQKIVTF